MTETPAETPASLTSTEVRKVVAEVPVNEKTFTVTHDLNTQDLLYVTLNTPGTPSGRHGGYITTWTALSDTEVQIELAAPCAAGWRVVIGG